MYGPGALVVRVVAAPHEAVRRRASLRAVQSAGPGLARAHPAVLVEVLGRARGSTWSLPYLSSPIAPVSRTLAIVRVELREQRRDPRAARLGHHELQPREALEHAGEQHVHERPLAVEAHLGDLEQHRAPA